MYLHDACWEAVNKFQGEMMYALCMKGKENGLVAIRQMKHDKTLQKGKTNFLNNFSITIIVSYIDGYTSMCIYGL